MAGKTSDLTVLRGAAPMGIPSRSAGIAESASESGERPWADALRTLQELTKFWISVTSTLSAVTVFILSKGGVGWDLLPLFAGVLLLAAGASTLNEYQERKLDARMERTRLRPIPSGRVSPRAALALAAALVAAGATVLWYGNDPAAGALGLLAVLWYNGLYTPLKRLTAFAVVPGSVIGALPPAIGWVAGGHALLDPRALVLCFFFFIWQIPHFWLLLFKYGKEYQSAGYPSLTEIFDRTQLARLTFVWMCVTGASTMLLPLFRAVEAPAVWVLLAATGAWLIWRAVPVLKAADDDSKPFRSAFMAINLFALAVMVLLVLDPYLVHLFPPQPLP